MSEPSPAPPSHPPAVSVTYTLTLDDLREALQPAPGAEQRKLRDKRLARQAGLPAPPKSQSATAWFGKGIFGWILFIGLSITLFTLLNKNPGRGAATPSRPPLPSDEPAPVDLWLSVIPSALGAAGVGVFTLTVTIANRIVRRRREKGTATPDIPSRMIMAGLLASLGLAILAVWVMIHPLFEIAWRPERFHVAIAAAAPWVIVFVIMIIVFRVAARRQTQTMYDTNPTFRREHTSRLDVEGLHHDDGVTHTLYRWPIFTSAWETERLLVLDDEVHRRHMLPKRALIDAGQLESARAQIVSHLSEADLFATPGAFPVNRPASQAPIPAIPLTRAENVTDAGRFQ